MLLASDSHIAIIGLGLTGFSCARYLTSLGKTFVGFDESTDPELANRFKGEFPHSFIVQGVINEQDFTEFSQLVLSPGVPLSTPSIQKAQQADIEIIGDIGLFMRVADKPVVAVTGSNGKSTVVSWLSHALMCAGKTVGLAGNIGVSPLELLASDEEYDVYILELSSFQLEIINKLEADVACVLNVTPDHLDRYPNMMAYHAAKQRIYRGAKTCVINKDDALCQPLLAGGVATVFYGLSKPDLNQYGVMSVNGDASICYGSHALLSVEKLSLSGKHQLSNALAVLAMCKALNVSIAGVLEGLQSFEGLPHRCQLVSDINNVSFIDDSKATNTGATIAAVKGLAHGKTIILIAGGVAKGADLADLKVLKPYLKALVLIGEAAEDLQTLFGDISSTLVTNMVDAVIEAKRFAQAGDKVLLSPACASFDLFKNYIDRGEQFVAAVKSMEALDAS